MTPARPRQLQPGWPWAADCDQCADVYWNEDIRWDLMDEWWQPDCKQHSAWDRAVQFFRNLHLSHLP